MCKITILITEAIKDPSRLSRHLKVFKLTGYDVELVLIQNRKLAKDDLTKLSEAGGFRLKEMLYPQDEDLLFRDVLEQISGEYLINLIPAQVYPVDFLENLFQEESPNNEAPLNRVPYKKRLLKAAQQSKYGLGIVKKDIKRDYPEFKISAAYRISDFTKLNFLELEMSEHFAADLKIQAQKTDLKTRHYTPNYKAIEYYSDFGNYKIAIKKEAPTLSYRDKPNAIGLPLYMLIFIILSLVMSPFFMPAIFPLLVMTALYLLALTLESLSISTLKKQGDLFPGLMVLFIFIHFYYLWYYLFSKVRNVH